MATNLALDEFHAERLEAFSQQLGISVAEEEDFGWIAEVGLQSPLPPRWTSHTDTSTGYVYYVDHDRQVSSWENPLVPFLRRVVEIGRAYLQTPTDTFFEEQKGLLWHQHKHDLDCWNGPFTDPEGRPYYINALANLSSWQDPRIDAQYIFELESGLLTSLQEVLPPPEDPHTLGFAEPFYGATAWRSDKGAEVLTLDGAQPGTGFRRKKSLRKIQSQALPGLAMKTAEQEHKTTVESLSAAAQKLKDLQEDDAETQRLFLARKAEARRKRIEAKQQPPPTSTLGGRLAPPTLDAAVDAGDGPQPPSAVLPPPPPPLLEGQSHSCGPRPPSKMLSKLQAKREQARLEAVGELGPPKQAPSPTAGKKMTLAPALEKRLALARRNRREQAVGTSAFTNLDLKAQPDSATDDSGTNAILEHAS